MWFMSNAITRLFCSFLFEDILTWFFMQRKHLPQEFFVGMFGYSSVDALFIGMGEISVTTASSLLFHVVLIAFLDCKRELFLVRNSLFVCTWSVLLVFEAVLLNNVFLLVKNILWFLCARLVTLWCMDNLHQQNKQLVFWKTYQIF